VVDVLIKLYVSFSNFSLKKNLLYQKKPSVLRKINVPVETGTKKTEFILFNNVGEKIDIQAMETYTLLLLSGTPLNEAVVSFGSWVKNTQEEIQQAFADFNSGKFGKL
jgi:redox-sensitive bicupin YhaK (pirin superfamily)